eukprot:m.35385 g.35385  ORF g.35385 m.35385 type:complete len:497 (-) comp6599_c0_seq3:1358-2848(-)
MDDSKRKIEERGEDVDQSEDGNPLKRAKNHYDANAQGENGETSTQRKESISIQLRKFHNFLKGKMISLYSRGVGKHLDIACGRGGDLHKWNNSRIRNVVGLDISTASIEEANLRLQRLLAEKKSRFQSVSFFATPDLGKKLIEHESLKDEESFDTVAIMFSAHYLFETEESASNMMMNVSRNLKDGGIFYGTIASGHAILELLHGQEVFESRVARIRKIWEGDVQEFGSGYTFSIIQTVTNEDVTSAEVGEGCVEFLSFYDVFTRIARKYGLYPKEDVNWEKEYERKDRQQRNNSNHYARYGGSGGGRRGDYNQHGRGQYDQRHFQAPPPPPPQPPMLRPCREKGFAKFVPIYPRQDANKKDLELVSSLYSSFVFYKDKKRWQQEKAEERNLVEKAKEKTLESLPTTTSATTATTTSTSTISTSTTTAAPLTDTASSSASPSTDATVKTATPSTDTTTKITTPSTDTASKITAPSTDSTTKLTAPSTDTTDTTSTQ